MNIHKEGIKADIEYLGKRKERLQNQIKVAKITIIGLNRKIKEKISLLG